VSLTSHLLEKIIIKKSFPILQAYWNISCIANALLFRHDKLYAFIQSCFWWKYFQELQLIIQGASKRASQLWKRIEIYTEDIQLFELSKYSKTHRVLPWIAVIRNYFGLFFRFGLHGTSAVTPTPCGFKLNFKFRCFYRKTRKNFWIQGL
jgi:hypothetical protein